MWHYMGCYSLAVRQVLQHCPTRRFVSGAYQSNRALRVRLLALLPSCSVYPHVAILGFSTILQPPAVQAAACQRVAVSTYSSHSDHTESCIKPLSLLDELCSLKPIMNSCLSLLLLLHFTWSIGLLLRCNLGRTELQYELGLPHEQQYIIHAMRGDDTIAAQAISACECTVILSNTM